jgi:hypothetical protein
VTESERAFFNMLAHEENGEKAKYVFRAVSFNFVKLLGLTYFSNLHAAWQNEHSLMNELLASSFWLL